MSDIRVTVVRWGERKALYMTYRDPISGKKVAKTTGCRKVRDAERAAAQWEDELNAGKFQAAGKVTWTEFRKRHIEERLAPMAVKTRLAFATAANHIERVLAPDRLAKLTTAAMSTFISRLRSEGMKEASIGTHVRSLSAALHWATDQGLLREAPKVATFKACGTRGQPITLEEFERMLAVAPRVRPQDAEVWRHYLRGLWLSGLRLAESVRLTWDADGDFVADLSGRRPCFRIAGKVQKSGRTEIVPMSPEFASFLAATPEADRHGRVFVLPNRLGGGRLTHERVGLAVGRFGKAAGVVVNKDEGRFATAHDLRRSFGTRWARRVMPAVLQKLMRHASIATTMQHYVGLQCDEVADELWAIHDAAGNSSAITPTVETFSGAADDAGSVDGSDCLSGGYGDEE